MTEIERLSAIEEIKGLKARYFRGVDTADAELVRGILAEDCELDYRGCCTDPASGTDHLPAMNVVLRGRAAWSAQGFAKTGIVSVHQGHHCNIELSSDIHAQGIWSMSDHLFMPAGMPFSRMIGYGHYHETYEKQGGAWKIKTLRISRLRVEVS